MAERIHCSGAVVGEPDALGATTTARTMPLLRSYVVFNAEQITWPEGSKHGLVEATSDSDGADDNYKHVEQIIGATGAEIDHQGTRAFYSPATDSITVPAKSRFDTPSAYYATALHEVAHWTGAESRLNRDLKGRFGSESYACEELIAELAAAFLSADLGVTGHLQHESYIASWIKVLKSDKRAIFTAARLAQEAADFILGRRAANGHVEPANDQHEAA